MTKEEFMERYKENLLRLWDSLRTEHKGEKDCVGVMCRTDFGVRNTSQQRKVKNNERI